MDVLRTPDERFADLPDFPYPPRYVQVPADDGTSLRIHYIEAGPADGPVVLLLHGEPSWCFLYRKMIPILAAAGLRAIAPDLVGFGRSDKPIATTDYTYQRHVDWMRGFLDALALADIHLFCQDWGGLIGLRLAGEAPARFATIAAANTFLPTGDDPMPEAFFRWRALSQSTPDLPVGSIVQLGSARPLAPEVVAAYDAPFPDAAYKAGARVFPTLVPAAPDDPASEPNRRAWAGLRGFTRPFLTLFGARDPITRGADARLQAEIPGARGQAHATIAGAGHFVQEDAGEELAERLVAFIRA